MYNVKELTGIRNQLLQHKQSLSVAESVTAGHLQAAFSLAENATDFFQGGITAYNLGQKARHLKIEPIQALACNCVSLKTSEEMAIGVSPLFSSDWGIGITGYAAPVPELNIHKLFAYYAFSLHGKIVATGKISAELDRPFQVQIHYADSVLKAFNKFLTGKSRKVNTRA